MYVSAIPVLKASSFNIVSCSKILQYDTPTSLVFGNVTLVPTSGIKLYVALPVLSSCHFLFLYIWRALSVRKWLRIWVDVLLAHGLGIRVKTIGEFLHFIWQVAHCVFLCAIHFCEYFIVHIYGVSIRVRVRVLRTLRTQDTSDPRHFSTSLVGPNCADRSALVLQCPKDSLDLSAELSCPKCRTVPSQVPKCLDPFLTTIRYVAWSKNAVCSHFAQEFSSCRDGRLFGHNRHGPKSGGCCAPFFQEGELGPHLTQCGLG